VRHFAVELEELNQALLGMGALVESSIHCSVQALVNRDERMARRVIEDEVHINQMELDIDARVIELLPDIKVPSLIVVGADDTPFLAASDYMAAKIPGAQKVVIPAAGHAVNIDQPKAFVDAVLPFLKNLPQ